MAARVVVVLLLIAAAGLVGFSLYAPTGPQPAVPSVDRLLSGSHWQMTQAYSPGEAGMVFREWSLVDSSGTSAILYVGTTMRAQTVFTWSGELGYLGEGYLVNFSSIHETPVGTQVGRITNARIQRGAVLKEIAYSVVRPDAIVASGADEPFGLGWDALGHRSAPYYAVRVTVPLAGSGQTASQTANALLTEVLTSLVRMQ